MREIDIPTLTDEPIQTQDEDYPQSPNKDLPRLHSLIISTGVRGSGKTMSSGRLTKSYEDTGVFDAKGRKVPVVTYLISPTAEENKVWKELKSLDYAKNVQHKYSENAFKTMIAEWKQENEDTRHYKEVSVLWKRFKKAEYPELSMTRTDLIRLSAATNGFSDDPRKPKYPNGVARFLILDDLLGTRAFRAGDNPVVEFCIRNRHQNTTVIIATQSLKGIPKPVRLNASVFNMFRTANAEALIRDCHTEVSRILNKEQFLKYFDHATSTPYGSLMLDMTAAPGRKIRRGWSTILSLDEDNVHENNLQAHNNEATRSPKHKRPKRNGGDDETSLSSNQKAGGARRY